MKETVLRAEHLTVRYGTREVLKDVSFELREGDWFMLIGPNGAGKSTIVNAVSRGVPYEGTITCAGKDIRTWRSQELARYIGVLAQNHFVGYAFRVREVVRLGRYSYSKGFLEGSDAEAEEKIEEALKLTGLTELADHLVTELSGGELQRVFLAQLFTQDPRILILDEPTNHLDLIYQKQVFRLIDEWRQSPGRAVISVVHDLSLAKMFGTGGLLLKDGKILTGGDTKRIFREEALREAYGLDVGEWMRTLLGEWA